MQNSDLRHSSEKLSWVIFITFAGLAAMYSVALLFEVLEEGREAGVEQMILKGISDADIRVITGISLVKITAIRKRLKK